MDLYGDLPPAAGEAPQTADCWARPKTNFLPRSQQTGQPPDSSPAKPSLMKPTTLAFKPRQTKALSAAPSSSVSRTAVGISAAPIVSIDTISRANVSTNDGNLLVNDESKKNNYGTDISESGIDANISFDVPNPYDPATPNDYLLWCEQRLERNRAQKVEEDNLRQIEERDRHRADMERVRAEAVVAGDFKLLQSTLGVGRGRGRGGVNNLPAWMTQQGASMTMTSSDTSTTQISSNNDLVETVGKRARSPSAYQDADETASNVGNVGSLMMSRMGYKQGDGLGKDGKGITQPIEHQSVGAGRGKLVLDEHNQARFEQSHAAVSSIVPSTSSTTSTSSSLVNAAVSAASRRRGLFSSPSCVILIKNMVGGGEVDQSLAPETKQECSKYGMVVECVVREISISSAGWMQTCPPEERVRVFVYFEAQESAIKAFKDLNGRFFGGRQICASFYDEEKYLKRDLDPVVGEW